MAEWCALLERESDPAKAADAIASQDYVLRLGARERGYAVYGAYVDAGVSGEVRERPGLLRLLDDAEGRRFTVVLATELGRLTRGGLADYFILKSELGRCGVRLEFLSGGDFGDDEESEVAPLYEAFEAVRPLIEKRSITRRFQSGKRRVWSEGFHWAGTPAYGYRYVPGGRRLGHWEVVPAEAEVIRRIFALAADGASMHEIAKRLDREAIPTQRGGTWWGSTISAILANPRYRGTFASCRYKAAVPKRGYRPRQVASPATGQPGQVRRRPKTGLVLRPEGEWQGVVKLDHLAIVDAETWERANRMRAVNRATSPRNAREPSLLHGLVYCEHPHGDGMVRKMTLKRPKGERPRWRCPWKAAPGGPYCGASMSAPVLEELVWERLVELASAPERMLASVATAMREMEGRRRAAAGRLAAAEALLAKQQATLDNLTVRWLAGEIGDEQYRRLAPRLEDVARAAARARNEAAAQVRDLEDTIVWAPAGAGEPVVQSLADLVRSVLEGASEEFPHWASGPSGQIAHPATGPSPDQKRSRIKRLVERVVIGPEGASMVVALSGEREALANTASPGCVYKAPLRIIVPLGVAA